MERVLYGVGTIAGRAAYVAVRFAQQSARQHRLFHVNHSCRSRDNHFCRSDICSM